VYRTEAFHARKEAGGERDAGGAAAAHALGEGTGEGTGSGACVEYAVGAAQDMQALSATHVSHVAHTIGEATSGQALVAGQMLGAASTGQTLGAATGKTLGDWGDAPANVAHALGEAHTGELLHAGGELERAAALRSASASARASISAARTAASSARSDAAAPTELLFGRWRAAEGEAPSSPEAPAYSSSPALAAAIRTSTAPTSAAIRRGIRMDRRRTQRDPSLNQGEANHSALAVHPHPQPRQDEPGTGCERGVCACVCVCVYLREYTPVL